MKLFFKKERNFKVTNKEWLEKQKKSDKHVVKYADKYICRQAKALEIIAEELIKCNEFLAYLKLKGVQIRK